MQRGLRILPEFGSSLPVTGMNLRIENKDFDLDEMLMLDAINRYYNNIAEELKVSHMPNMIPMEHIVQQQSRIVVTDQSVARIPIFSRDVNPRKFHNDRDGGLFAKTLPEFEEIDMVTLANTFVTQVIHRRLTLTAVHIKLPVKDIR